MIGIERVLNGGGISFFGLVDTFSFAFLSFVASPWDRIVVSVFLRVYFALSCSSFLSDIAFG